MPARVPRQAVCAMLWWPALAALAVAVLTGAPLAAQSLAGSARSLDAQNRQASLHDFTYLSTPAQVRRFVELGYLVPVRGNEDFWLKGVSYPYARPEVRDFIERLAERYREACGEQLVVTSLTRPKTRQPRHASRRSVHPTGMALDLRRSWNRRCRAWLEPVLLEMEGAGVLEATLEYSPPHYHLAVFPAPYRDRGADLVAAVEPTEHRVARGETLWKIASLHDLTVQAVKEANGLRSNRIYPGQILRLPTSR